MKNIIIFNCLLALTLCLSSCGGNGTQTQSQASDSTDTAAAAESKGDALSVKEDNLDMRFFYRFVEKLPQQSSDKKLYTDGDPYEDGNGNQQNEYYYAFPMKNGGYAAVYRFSKLTNHNTLRHWYRAFTYKDGQFQRADNILFDMLGKYNLKDQTELDSVTTLVIDFTTYDIQSQEPEICAVLCPHHLTDKDNYLVADFDSLQVFRWDGDKFVNADFMSCLPSKPDRPVYHGLISLVEDELGFKADIHHYALPMKSGGYLDINTRITLNGPFTIRQISTCTYQNGTVKKVDGVLPVPTIDELLPPEKNKDADITPNDIKKNPEDFYFYRIGGNGELTLCAEGDGWYPWSETPYTTMEDVLYIWDGVKFIKESKPADCKSTVAYKGSKLIDVDRETYNIEKCKGYLQYHFESDCEGCEGSFDLYCFPLKDGGYMVITQEEDFDILNYNVYTYKDGKLNKSDAELPVCSVTSFLDYEKMKGHEQDVDDLEEIYNRKPQDLIKYWFDTSKQEVRMSLYARFHDEPYWKTSFTDMLCEFSDIPRYKWNGEQFRQ